MTEFTIVMYARPGIEDNAINPELKLYLPLQDKPLSYWEETEGDMNQLVFSFPMKHKSNTLKKNTIHKIFDKQINKYGYTISSILIMPTVQ
jgi:hypothetical protein